MASRSKKVDDTISYVQCDGLVSINYVPITIMYRPE